MHTAVAVARSELDIGDAAIEGMSGIYREMRRPVELDVMPDGPKFPPAREGLSYPDFQGSNRHRAPPSVLACNAAPDRRTKSNRLAEVKSRLNSRTAVGDPVGAWSIAMVNPLRTLTSSTTSSSVRGIRGSNHTPEPSALYRERLEARRAFLVEKHEIRHSLCKP